MAVATVSPIIDRLAAKLQLALVSRSAICVGFHDAARMLGVSVHSLRRLADDGELRTVRLRGRRLIQMEELRRIAGCKT
jgi:excisionase family DNA binding protein